MAGRTFVVWGTHAVRTLLERAPSDVLELWVAAAADDAPGAETIVGLAGARGLAVQSATTATLDRMTAGGIHQGLAARRRAPGAPTLEALLDGSRAGRLPLLLLVLDRVQDPHNLGACLRVADGAGVDAIIAPRAASAPLSGVVAKTASGAMDTVPYITVANLAQALKRIKAAGVWLTGTSHDAPLDLYDCDFTPATAVVLGAEGEGLRRLTREACDFLAAIPMVGRVPNLNVSTAAAVCLFEAARQRRPLQPGP